LNAFKDDCQQQRLLQKEAEKREAENKASGMALCSQPITIFSKQTKCIEIENIVLIPALDENCQ